VASRKQTEPLPKKEAGRLVLNHKADSKRQEDRGGIYRAVFGTTPMLFTYWFTPDRRVDDVNFEVE
jgi:hypothetical protein